MIKSIHIKNQSELFYFIFVCNFAVGLGVLVYPKYTQAEKYPQNLNKIILA